MVAIIRIRSAWFLDIRISICFCIETIADKIAWLCYFVDYHLVPLLPYECASMGLVVIEASMWLL